MSLALLAIAVVALALRLWPLDHFSVDFQDEGAYWQSLKAMAAGHPLFSVVFSSQPPFFLSGLLPFYLLFGQTLVAARLGVALYSLLGLAAIYYIGRATAGRWAGVLACALLAVDPLYLAESHTLQAEMPSEALALAGVALAAAAIGCTGMRRRWRATASGVALGLGVMTKLFDLGALVPAVLYLAAPRVATTRDARGRPGASRWRDIRAGLRVAAPDLALLVIGLVVTCALVLAPFLPVRGLVYDQVVRFHQVAEQTNALGKKGWYDNVLLIRDTVVYYASAPYLLLAFVGVALALWRRAWAVLPPLAWLVVSLGLLVHQQPLIWHHVVLLAPVLALLAGAALPLARGPQPQPVTPHPRIRSEARVGGEGVLTYSIAILVAIAALASLLHSIEANHSAVVSFPPAVPNPSAAIQGRMVVALRDHTRPSEEVVTDGQYIAGLAGHSVPAELVDTSFVRIDAGQRDARYFSLRQLEAIIARDHVRTILFATKRLDLGLPGFRPWVEQRYRRVESFGEWGALYQR